MKRMLAHARPQPLNAKLAMRLFGYMISFERTKDDPLAKPLWMGLGQGPKRVNLAQLCRVQILCVCTCLRILSAV